MSWVEEEENIVGYGLFSAGTGTWDRGLALGLADPYIKYERGTRAGDRERDK